jgi:hypothetical protein
MSRLAEKQLVLVLVLLLLLVLVLVWSERRPMGRPSHRLQLLLASAQLEQPEAPSWCCLRAQRAWGMGTVAGQLARAG